MFFDLQLFYSSLGVTPRWRAAAAAALRRGPAAGIPRWMLRGCNKRAETTTP